VGYHEPCAVWIGRHPILMDHPFRYARLCRLQGYKPVPSLNFVKKLSHLLVCNPTFFMVPYFDAPPVGYAHHLCVWTGGGPFAGYKEGCSIKIGQHTILMDHPIGYAHWSICWLQGRVLQQGSAVPYFEYALFNRVPTYFDGLPYQICIRTMTHMDCMSVHCIRYALQSPHWICSSLDKLISGYTLHGIHSSWDTLFMGYALHGIRSSCDMLFMGYTFHGIRSSCLSNGCACWPTPSDTFFMGMSHQIHSSWVWNGCVWTHTPWAGIVWMGIGIHTLQ
jgi:hypothetical protein